MPVLLHSFHKFNRNTRKVLRYADEFTGLAGTVVTSSTHDNAFITHQIPRSDMQYAWITGNTENEIIGYQEKNYALGDYASSDIIFPSRSGYVSVYVQDTGWEFGVDYDNYIANSSATPGTDEMLAGKFIPTLFNHVVTNVQQPVSGNESILGYSSDIPVTEYLNDTLIGEGLIETHGGKYNENAATASLLNAILLNRQGPYGGANWKLYKKDYHPIVRHHRKNNNIVWMHPWGGTETPKTLTRVAYDKQTTFIEPPITSKYKPLVFDLPSREGDEYINTLMTLGNTDSHFTDHTKELKNFLGYDGTISNNQFTYMHFDEIFKVSKVRTFKSYQAFLFYLKETTDMNKVKVTYSETIYPKGLYTYLSGSRKRLNFGNLFWRDDRAKRTMLNYPNGMDESIRYSSIWKMDANTEFSENADSIPDGAILASPKHDGTGELQNAYCLFHYRTASNVIPAVNYNRRIKHISPDYLSNEKKQYDSSVLPATFYDRRELIVGMPYVDYLTDPAAPARFSASVGDTLWQVTSSFSHGKPTYKPFYDSYDEYAEEGFRGLKDGTILPEFRISERMDNYINENVSMNYIQYSPMDFFAVSKNKDLDPSKPLHLATGLLGLTGSSINSLDTSKEISDFLERYTFSDFYKYFKPVEADYADKRSIDENLLGQKKTTQQQFSCDAILKFLPYDGFYPAERTRQLGGMFYDNINGEGSLTTKGTDKNIRTMMQPFFAPGILYNSIKSGIAVDYPICTGSVLGHEIMSATSSLIWGSSISASHYDKRLNIDNLIQPHVLTVQDMETDIDLALNSTASLKTINKVPTYTFAMSNFLAASQGIFLQPNEQGTNPAIGASIESGEFISIAGGDYEKIVPPVNAIYSMDLVLQNSKNIVNESDFIKAKRVMQGYINDANYIGYPSVTSSLFANTSSVTMYSRANKGSTLDPFLYGSSFGPPVHCGDMAENLLNDESQLSGSDVHGTSFDPYTPPYYNGYSRVRISVPLTAGIHYDVDDVLAALTHSYDRINTFLYPTVPPVGGTYAASVSADYATQTSAYLNAMQLSASIYDGNKSEQLGNGTEKILYYKTYAPIDAGDGTTLQKQSKKIVFKPRWECPVLDFRIASPQQSFVTASVAKGMWHQYGDIPQLGTGIKMFINPGTPQYANADGRSVVDDDTRDLAEILKFSSKSSAQFRPTIGKLRREETFSEAIILVPFKYDNKKGQTSLYKIDYDMFNLIKKAMYFSDLDKFLSSPTVPIRTWQEIVEKYEYPESLKPIYDLFIMCRKYVFPPHMDLLHNPDFETAATGEKIKGSPDLMSFVMYAMEFEIDLNVDDLRNIWQNVEPTFARKALKQTSVTNVSLMPTDNVTAIKVPADKEIQKIPQHPFYRTDRFNPENTRWAVFKVKKRARNNFNAIAGKARSGFIRGDQKDNPTQKEDFLYSYNWPYDFFSLIELAKINSITTFNGDDESGN